MGSRRGLETQPTALLNVNKKAEWLSSSSGFQPFVSKFYDPVTGWTCCRRKSKPESRVIARNAVTDHLARNKKIVVLNSYVFFIITYFIQQLWNTS
jgi:hypothetical protein